MIVLPPRLIVSRSRRVSTTCLVLPPDLPQGCASELQVLKGKLTPVLNYQAARDGSGPGESWYSSKPAPFGPGMDYMYWTVDVYGDTRINPHVDGGGDGLTLTPAQYPPRPRYPLNK